MNYFSAFFFTELVVDREEKEKNLQRNEQTKRDMAIQNNPVLHNISYFSKSWSHPLIIWPVPSVETNGSPRSRLESNFFPSDFKVS